LTFIKRLVLLLVLFQFLNFVQAQDQQLFEHTWYFHSGVLNENDLILPYPEFRSQLNMSDENLFTIMHLDCGEVEELQGEIYFETSSNVFNLSDGTFILFGACTDSEFNFIYKLYSIFYIEEDVAKNPFTYAIEYLNDYLQLTITNGEGDWAVYNSVLLSATDFSKDTFAIYPNPVKETLNINNNSNQRVTAIIYDLNGKLLQSHTIENNTTALSVKSLDQGLYFIVFETETGERISKKFVKR